MKGKMGRRQKEFLDGIFDKYGLLAIPILLSLIEKYKSKENGEGIQP